MLRLVSAGALVVTLTACYNPEDNCEDSRTGRIGAFVASHHFVEQKLRSPATADFPLTISDGVIVNFERECHFKVAGYVDSENGFGATVRTRYIIDIEADPKDGGYWGRNLMME